MARTANGQQAAAAKGQAGVSKMDAVRQAIRQLGRDAKPRQIQGVIKEQFGVEMTLDHISNYKSTIRKQAGGKAKKAAKGPAAPQPAAHKPAAPAAVAKPAAAAGSGKGGDHLSVEDGQTVKALLSRLRPDSLKGLIDVLAR
jgi:hypothetical protein